MSTEQDLGASETEFSLENLKSHFENCVGEDEKSLSVEKYLLGKFGLKMYQFSRLFFYASKFFVGEYLAKTH